MDDRDAIQLIFLPGFSTAEKVTNISGRGVGMDVVKTNVERIGGAVEVVSEKGRGTTVRIKIPLTLAIIPGLVVDDQRSALRDPAGQSSGISSSRRRRDSQSHRKDLQAVRCCAGAAAYCRWFT